MKKKRNCLYHHHSQRRQQHAWLHSPLGFVCVSVCMRGYRVSVWYPCTLSLSLSLSVCIYVVFCMILLLLLWLWQWVDSDWTIYVSTNINTNSVYTHTGKEWCLELCAHTAAAAAVDVAVFSRRPCCCCCCCVFVPLLLCWLVMLVWFGLVDWLAGWRFGVHISSANQQQQRRRRRSIVGCWFVLLCFCLFSINQTFSVWSSSGS